MDINNEGIANSASQPLSSDTHNEASISQLISSDILPSSQPLLLSDQSRVEIVTRHRVARRRRRRRTQGQHQQLAQQIRRRHMSNQYRQQQEYHRNDREDRDRSNDTRPPSSTIGEQFEEVIEERLQEVYDWEIMQLMDQWEQEQLNGLEDIAALEQLSVAQDEMEQPHQIPTSQTLGEEQGNTQGQTPNNWVRTQLDADENIFPTNPLHSILHQMEKPG
jgi:hypothetical protein